MNETFYDVYGQEIEFTGEQKACLKYTGERTLLVKGYAGAGKSIVLMAIAEKYKQAYGNNAANKVAIFTYQNTLVSTIKESLLENDDGANAIFVSTFNSYCQEVYNQLVKMNVAPRRKFPEPTNAGEEKRLKNVRAALREHKAIYGKHRFHDLDLAFWLEEFDWMKDMNVWMDDLDYYLSIPRTGRGGKVRMRASERETAYQIFQIYCKYLERTRQGDWADQSLFIIRHRDMLPSKMKYEHVLIDEAQDLSLAQMIAILGIYTKDMTVAMDMNQRIHGKYWTPKLLGISTTTKKLTKSMRTTKQIDNLAESIRSYNDSQLEEDDKSIRAIPEKDGPLPRLVHLKDQPAEKKYVIELVQSFLQKSDKITIGIIGAKKNQLTVFSSWLTDAGIQHEIMTKNTTFSMKKPGVKVVTAFGSKGLEFNVVIIPMFVQGNYPYNRKTDDQEALNSFMIQMRNLVYVSMTRAKAQLVITYWGTGGSQFIGEMDPSLYSLEGGPIDGTYAEPIGVITGDTTIRGTYTANLGKDNAAGISEQNHQNGDRELKQSSQSSPSDTQPMENVSLYDYLKNVGVAVSDNRNKGGALWIKGTKAKLYPVINATRNQYGAYWIYNESWGGYFTKCAK